MADASTFAGLLREHRHRVGLTQEQLATRAGVSKEAVGTLERGFRTFPRRDTVERLARGLGLDRAQTDDLVAAASRRRGRPAAATSASTAVPGWAREHAPATSALPRADLRPTIPRQLPPMSSRLIGRDRVCAHIVAELGDDGDQDSAQETSPAPPRIVVLAGVGGSGKTALAIAIGHSLSASFVDGTLYADLGADARGGRVGARALAPASPNAQKPEGDAAFAVHGRFLRALGVAPEQISQDRTERLGQYRSAVDGKRILVVLDGATTEDQVRQLGPTSPGSATIVTSRTKLAGLTGVQRHTLRALDHADAIALIQQMTGEAPRADSTDVLREIADLCGGLPLALCVAGARLATQAHLGAAHLRDRLTNEHARLDELTVGDISVRASIAAALDTLTPEAATLFRRLSLAPGQSWPTWLVMLLVRDAFDEITAQRALDELVMCHLIDPAGYDDAGQPRFDMHGLVSALAHEEFQRIEPLVHDDLTRTAAAVWLALASTAGDRLSGPAHAASVTSPGPTTLQTSSTATTTIPSPDLPDDAIFAAQTDPLAWFEAERTCLIGTIERLVARNLERETATRLALALDPFLTLRSYDTDRERVLRHALTRYPKSADQHLHAAALMSLFGALARQRRMTELPEVAARALDVARRLGDVRLELRALSQLGWSAMMLERFDEALGHYSAAEQLAATHSDHTARTRAAGQRGVVLRNAGRPDEGDPLLASMVDVLRTAGTRRELCIWLITRAEGLIDQQDFTEARTLIDEALAIATELQDDVGVANSLLARGRVELGEGNLAAARHDLTHARRDLDARVPGGADLDCLRLHADIAAAEADWAEVVTTCTRLVDARRRATSRLALAADLARLGRALGELSDPTATEALDSTARILSELNLERQALRLPVQL